MDQIIYFFFYQCWRPLFIFMLPKNTKKVKNTWHFRYHIFMINCHSYWVIKKILFCQKVHLPDGTYCNNLSNRSMFWCTGGCVQHRLCWFYNKWCYFIIALSGCMQCKCRIQIMDLWQSLSGINVKNYYLEKWLDL